MNGLLFGLTIVLIAAGIGGEKLAWWEIPLPVLLSWIIFGIFRDAAIAALVSDIRYLHSYITSATRELEWVEEVHYTVQVYDGQDSNGNAKFRTESRVRYETHPERWFATDAHGNDWELGDYEDFVWYCNRFGEPEYANTAHSGQYSGGGMYVTTWPETDQTLWPVSFTEKYENRGQATANVYKYRTLTVEETKGLYYYPPTDKWVIDGFLVPEGLSLDENDVAYIRMLWAKLGVEKNVTPWVLIFKDEPINIAVLQETFWQRGNDNDVVICIGIEGRNNTIIWTKVFAWSEDNVLEEEIGAKIFRQRMLDPKEIGDLIYKELSSRYQLPDFDTMFKHIKIEVPTSTLMWSSLTSTLLGGALLYWVLTNSYNWIEELANLNQFFEKLVN